MEQPGLRPGHGVGEALSAMAQEILAEARAALCLTQENQPVAVHDFRKAMKRWRALLRLLAPIVGEEAEERRKAARDLARTLATARDGQAALDALEDVAKATSDMPGALSPRSIAVMRGRLDNARKAAETAALGRDTSGLIEEMLRRDADCLARWPLSEARFGDVASGLTEAFARARSSMPSQWEQVDAEALHGWRRDVVVHRYQMQLVEPLWPRLGRLWTGEAQRLRERLGACQNLTVLLALTAPHHTLAPWRSRLICLIEATRAIHLAGAARLGGRLFAETPQAFRKRMRAMWKNDAARPQPTGATEPGADRTALA
jgi:CHAD domain-containing protein